MERSSRIVVLAVLLGSLTLPANASKSRHASWRTQLRLTISTLVAQVSDWSWTAGQRVDRNSDNGTTNNRQLDEPTEGGAECGARSNQGLNKAGDQMEPGG